MKFKTEYTMFIQKKLSIIERIEEIIDGIDWLSTTVVEHDCGICPEERYPFINRWRNFLDCLRSAILGYIVWLRPSKSSKYVPLE